MRRKKKRPITKTRDRKIIMYRNKIMSGRMKKQMRNLRKEKYSQ